MGCSAGTTNGLTGNYRQDTLTVVENLTTMLDMPSDAPDVTEQRQAARDQMNDYASRYRRDGRVSGLRSFTTMQTALNSLAGFYSTYGSRPLSDKLKTRLKQEFKQVEIALKRGL
jgi:photosystem II Psb27 protein